MMTIPDTVFWIVVALALVAGFGIGWLIRGEWL